MTRRAAKRKPERATPRLDAQCTLREAESFKLWLLQHEDSSGDFALDGSAVERIDTAGLQLLVAFAARLALAERRLVWTDASTSLRDSARRLGLEDALGLAP